MTHFARHLFILSALFSVASCDWPWALDRPDDPLNCDPVCVSPAWCYEGICHYPKLDRAVDARLDRAAPPDRRRDTSRKDKGKPDQRRKDLKAAPDLQVKPDKGGGALKVHQAPVKLTFDKTNGGLVGTRDWEWKKGIKFNYKDPKCDGKPISPPLKAYSGTGMWGTVINGCYKALGNDATNSSGKCTNNKTSDDSVLRFRVKIPSAWKLVDLTFYHWSDINYPYDWNEVRVDDGSGPKQIKLGSTIKGQYCKTKHAVPSAWVKETLFLDTYAGKTVTISFHFMASNAVNKAGWYIDDLHVKKYN